MAIMKQSKLIIFKSSLYQHLVKEVNYKIDALSNEIKLLDQSRDSNTKSSAGDKYETDRSMVQLELEKYQSQLII